MNTPPLPLYSYPPEKIRILLLEGIHPVAQNILSERGYQVECRQYGMTGDQFAESLEGIHLVGIRSKSTISKEVLKRASSLLAIGCFGIGTNQVDLCESATVGVPVFNAPFGSTRSVAELTIGEMILLSRRAVVRNSEMHRGTWKKITGAASEVRGKTIGIVGYGHIGQQVALLSESLGMKVIFYDIVPKLPFGNAVAVASLQDLLRESDVVTLHVPETSETIGMIGNHELRCMKQGAILLNLSRGSIVDLDALQLALESNHLGGAGLDVYPEEPESNGEGFVTPVTDKPNVFLTPHIGAATVEAQENIGREVALALRRFLEQGSTTGAVNFPHVELPIVENAHRVLHIHRNIPGVLRDVNEVIANLGANIYRQFLSTQGEVGYLIMDVERTVSRAVKQEIDALPATIRTRLLF